MKGKTNYLFKHWDVNVIHKSQLKAAGFIWHPWVDEFTVMSFFNNLYWRSWIINAPAVCPRSQSHWKNLAKQFLCYRSMIYAMDWSKKMGFHKENRGSYSKGKATEVVATDKLQFLTDKKRKLIKSSVRKKFKTTKSKVSEEKWSLVTSKHLNRCSRDDVKRRLAATNRMFDLTERWVLGLNAVDVINWLAESENYAVWCGRVNNVVQWVLQDEWWEILWVPMILKLQAWLFPDIERRMRDCRGKAERIKAGGYNSANSYALRMVVDKLEEMGCLGNFHLSSDPFNHPQVAMMKGLKVTKESSKGVDFLVLPISPSAMVYETVYASGEIVYEKCRKKKVDLLGGGGRLYSPFTVLPSVLRKGLVVSVEGGDWEKMIEWDIPAAQLRLMFSKVGVPFPENGWESFSMSKPAMKAFVVYAIGSAEKGEGFSPWRGFINCAAFKELAESDRPSKVEFDKALMELSPVKDLLFNSFWKEAHKIESSIIAKVASSMDVLTIHDAVFCPLSQSEAVVRLLKKVWWDETNQVLVMKEEC